MIVCRTEQEADSLVITFTKKASKDDPVKFSFSAVVDELQFDTDVSSPEEHLSAVCLSIYRAVQSVSLARLRLLLDDQPPGSNCQALGHPFTGLVD